MMHSAGAQTKVQKPAMNGNDSANLLAQQQQLLLSQQPLSQGQQATNQQVQGASGQQQAAQPAAGNQNAQQNANAASGANASATTTTTPSNTIGSGTTNQQRLKSHVQQFVNKIRKESDKFYKRFVEVCKSNRDPEKSIEFHTEMGKLFTPYGDLLTEINKMLHQAYQYNIPEASQNTTLKGSDISNESINRLNVLNNSSGASSGKPENPKNEIDNPYQIGGRKPQNNNSDIEVANGGIVTSGASQPAGSGRPAINQKELVTQKLSEFCTVIKQDCPDKMNQFVTALKQKLNGQEDQLRLFIQTCLEIFGEGHSIYQKAQSLFKEIPTGAQQGGNSDNGVVPPTAPLLNQTNDKSQQEKGPTVTKKKKKEKAGKTTPSIINDSKSNNNNNNHLAGPSKDANNDITPQQPGQTNLNPPSGVQPPINGHVKGSALNKDINLSPPSTSGYNIPPSHPQEHRNISSRKNESQNDYPPSVRQNEFEPPIPRTQNIVGATKPESQFIYQIDNHMDSIAFMNMLKLLYLYVECIITASEMIEQGSYLLQGFNNPEKLIEQLKDLVECRESSRRKATPYFKPLNDFDFNHHERFTHSYVEMPKFYPKYCSNSTELTRSVLNTSIVTVPQGTEHVTFSIMRKNQYEEQLFKSEDEKYEYDHHIQMYRRTIKLLEQVEVCEDPEQCRRLMQLAIDLKMIICLYKNGSPEQQEICEILLNNPKKTVSVALERVKNKLREIEEAKMNQAKKAWHEVAEKNFHRSLDHRSFIFKRHDRKFTLSTRFEKEPEFRNRMLMRISSYQTHQQQLHHQQILQQQQQQQLLQMQQGSTRSAGAAMAVKQQHLNEDGIENNQDFETDVTNYFTCLNTFQGTTNIEKCSHASHEEQLTKQLKDFDHLNVPRKYSLPMMTFIFEDPQICEDTFSLLMHYQLYAALNQSEREKIKRTAQMVLKGFFDLSFKAIEQSDITLNENKIIKIVTEIENKIFEKIYAYLRPINRDGGDADKSSKGQDGDAMVDENEENEKDGDKNKSDDKNGDDEDGDDKENGEEKDKKKDEDQNSKPTKGKNTKSPSSHTLNSANKKQSTKDSNETEMDIEHEGNESRKNKSQEGDQGETQEKTNNNNQSSLNDILDDENSKTGEKIREMNYNMDKIEENVYLPKFDAENTQVFYGSKNLYIFLRFFYVLYERLYKAQEISRYFEDNEKTQKLTDEEKEELAKERYSTFKNILIGSLKQRETKYEDYLRSIFGKQAFLMFTIDKTLQSATKSLQALASDELSQKLLQLYIHPEEFRFKSSIPPREETLYVKINKIILDSTHKISTSQSEARSFFRFSRLKNSNILYINYIDSYYRNWDLDQINKSREYFEHYMNEPTPAQINKTNNSELPIYLSRNKKKNAEKVQQKQLQVFQANNIEYHTFSNTNHIINSNNSKEDFLITSSKLKRRAIPIEQVISIELKKKTKFEQWYNKQAESIIQLKKPAEIKKNNKTSAAPQSTTNNNNTNNNNNNINNTNSTSSNEEIENKSAVQQNQTTHITTAATEKSVPTEQTNASSSTPSAVSNSQSGANAASSEMKSE